MENFDDIEEGVAQIPPENIPAMQELYAQVGDDLFANILYRLHYAGNMAVNVIAEKLTEDMMSLRDQALEVHKVNEKPDFVSDLDAGIGLGIAVTSAFFLDAVREMLPLNIDFDKFAEEIKRALNQAEKTRQ